MAIPNSNSFIVCKQCKQSLPATSEYFQPHTTNGVLYLENYCYNCKHERASRKHHGDNYEIHKTNKSIQAELRSKGFQRCIYGDECVHPNGPILPLNSENFEPVPKSHTRTGWRGFCRKCRNFRAHIIRYKDNPEKLSDMILVEQLRAQGLKRCARCRKVLALTTENYHQSNKSLSGFKSFCIPCEREYAREFFNSKGDDYRKKKQEYSLFSLRKKKELDPPIGDPTKTKICTSCKRELPATQDYFTKHLGCRFNVNSVCRECHTSKAHERYASDPVLRSERAIKNHDRLIRLRNTEPDKYANAERVRAEKRRTLKANRPLDYTQDDWEFCLSYWDHKCCICGRSRGLWHKIAQDHWIPLSDPSPDNPGTVPSNILPICHASKGSVGLGSCNQSKKNKEPIEWLNDYLGKRAAKKKLAEIEAYFASVRR